MVFKRLSDFLPKEEEDIISKTQEKVSRKLSDFLPSADTTVVDTKPAPTKTPDPFAFRKILERDEVISASPRRRFDLTQAPSDSIVGKIQRAIKENFFDPIKKGLFGSPRERLMVEELPEGANPLLSSLETEGFARTIFPTFFDTDAERFSEAFDSLVKTS